MTKRTLALLSAMFLLILSAWGAPVTQDQAREAAATFMQQKQSSVLTPRMAAQSPSMQIAANTGYYYIYNVGNDNGFVIVSGDDRTNPILGYSTEGHFDATKVPSNMQAMLDGYAAQLQRLATMSDVEAATVLAAPRRAQSVNTRNSIAPLITTKWDQATPYWNHCPQFMNSDDEADGYELAYTGCVATAMSQIMYFHKYPAEITQEIPSYTFTYSDGNYNYGTYTMDALPPTTFDWEHMRDTYTGAEDEVYTDAVAKLMLYVGCSVKMQYGVSSSGAYTDDIPKGFGYFGYGSKIAFRIDYDQQSWDDLVYNELAAGRPMIYNGTAGSGGGHSFICDGFEAGDYFHINWGWGGMGNGYFQLSIMNPSASGIGGSSSSEGYNMKQNVIYNIIPGGVAPGDDDDDEPMLTATNIECNTSWFERERLSDPFKLCNSKWVKIGFSDHSGSGKRFKNGLALYDPANDTYTMIPGTDSYGFATVTTSALGESRKIGYGVDSRYTTMLFGAGMTGTYRLVPMYLLEGTDQWKPMKESDRFYLELNMTQSSATVSKHPIVNLTVTGWEFTGGEKVGVKEQVHATIHNGSQDRYFGDIYLDFGGQQLDEYSQYTSVVQAEIPAGQDQVVTFNVTPATAGTKTVNAMLVDAYGSLYNIAGTPGTVTIVDGGSTDFDVANLSVVIRAENAVAGDNEGDNGVIYDSHAHFSAAITNNGTTEYNKYILAPLFIVENGKGSMVSYQQLTISVPAGETRTYYFDFDNLAFGSTYAMNIYARNNVPMEEDASHVDNIVKPGESVYYDIRPGIVVWSADGARQGVKPVEGYQVPANAAAVSLEGLNLTSITPNENPNTIYVLDENATVPASLNGKNVVKGQNATEIVLEDGYPYLVPQSVNAGKVTYKRTFTQARKADERTAWSTMVLPFAATTVSIDGHTPVANTDYWVFNFPREDDGAVTFDAATTMEANVPYLVAVASDRDMTGKVMSWSADNVLLKAEPIAITSGMNYMFSGTYIPVSEGNIYTMDAQGARFVLHDTPQAVAPFRAYFKAMQTVDATEILCPGTTEVTPQTLKGDVNNDGKVDVTDVNILINIMLGKDNADKYDGRAYVTEGDTAIDVSDVNAVINIMLGK